MERLIIFLFTFCLMSCGQKKSTETTQTGEEVVQTRNSATPSFNVDSAYLYISEQVAFGPRVPNTEAHKLCSEYLSSKLESFGAKVHVQEAILTAYNNTKLEARNIIGVYNPEKEKRILLFAHWDSRPYADADPDRSKHRTHIDGADDGASGVGVLLEIARQIKLQSPEIGIDIIFFDAEDYGAPYFAETDMEDSWCLGSQYWAKNPHVPNYKAEFGILLDMVGGKDATFYKERYSTRYAANIVEKIWSTARSLGYGRFFINSAGGYITDDHIYVMEGLNIPCVNIINFNPNTKKGFNQHWHTVNDNMENIDKKTLSAVGHTVMEVIYNQ